MNAKQSKALERHFAAMHGNPPLPPNPDARPVLHEAVSAAYAEYWERNPESTREAAREFHRSMHESLKASFPSYRESSEKAKRHADA